MPKANELMRLDRARAALARAKDIRQIKKFIDMGAAAKAYAKRAGLGLQAQQDAALFHIQACQAAGQFLTRAIKDKGGRPTKKKPPSRKKGVSLSEIGISSGTSSRWQALGRITKRDLERWCNERRKAEEEITATALYTAFHRAERDAKREERTTANEEKVATAADPAALTGVYQTILLDPPWDFSEEDPGGSDQFGGSRLPTYSTMTDDEIGALPVGQLADDNAHVYLWITNRSLLTGKGWRLLEGWGFRPVTILTWCKPSIGVGSYYRNNTEHIVFGVKGSLPLQRKNVGTWFEAKRGGGHSAKPAAAYELIEECSPGPYLEMFARRNRKGWVSWGEDS